MENEKVQGNCGCVVSIRDEHSINVWKEGELGTARFFFCGKDERCKDCPARNIIELEE